MLLLYDPSKARKSFEKIYTIKPKLIALVYKMDIFLLFGSSLKYLKFQSMGLFDSSLNGSMPDIIV